MRFFDLLGSCPLCAGYLFVNCSPGTASTNGNAFFGLRYKMKLLQTCAEDVSQDKQ